MSRMPSGATSQAERAERGERIRFFTAAGGEPGRVFRACTVFDHELGTQRVVELCGHAFCSNGASASPGSRCADHLGDPVPDGCGPDLWLHLAGEAAKSWNGPFLVHAEDEHGAADVTPVAQAAVWLPGACASPWVVVSCFCIPASPRARARRSAAGMLSMA